MGIGGSWQAWQGRLIIADSSGPARQVRLGSVGLLSWLVSLWQARRVGLVGLVSAQHARYGRIGLSGQAHQARLIGLGSSGQVWLSSSRQRLGGQSQQIGLDRSGPARQARLGKLVTAGLTRWSCLLWLVLIAGAGSLGQFAGRGRSGSSRQARLIGKGSARQEGLVGAGSSGWLFGSGLPGSARHGRLVTAASARREGLLGRARREGLG